MMAEINALKRRVRALQRIFARELASYGWAEFVTTFANAGSPLGPTTSPCPKSGPSSSGLWTPAIGFSHWVRPTTT